MGVPPVTASIRRAATPLQSGTDDRAKPAQHDVYRRGTAVLILSRDGRSPRRSLYERSPRRDTSRGNAQILSWDARPAGHRFNPSRSDTSSVRDGRSGEARSAWRLSSWHRSP